MKEFDHSHWDKVSSDLTGSGPVNAGQTRARINLAIFLALAGLALLLSFIQNNLYLDKLLIAFAVIGLVFGHKGLAKPPTNNKRPKLYVVHKRKEKA